MNFYKFQNPYIFKDWYIFPNTTISNINFSDCTKSTKGKCIKTENIQQCTQLCKDDKDCSMGYFIQTPDNDNLCMTMNDNYENIKNDIPYYRLRSKNIYPILKNMKSSVFINKKYPFPPENQTNIFYTDLLSLNILNTKKTIGIDSESGKVFINEFENFPLQFLPKKILKTNSHQYNSLKNGDEVVISIPNTAYVLSKDLNWVLNTSQIHENPNVFIIKSTDPLKTKKDSLTYLDKLILEVENQFVFFNTENNAISLSSEKKTIFKPIPKIKVYYCNNNRCVSESMENIIDKDIRFYRYPSCWNLCDIKKTKKNLTYVLILLIFSFFIALLSLINYCF